MLEPAAWALPVLSGPYLFNFEAVSALLVSEGAMAIVEDSEALAEQVIRLFAQPNEAKRMGLQAQRVVVENRGALDKQFALIQGLMGGC